MSILRGGRRPPSEPPPRTAPAKPALERYVDSRETRVVQ